MPTATVTSKGQITIPSEVRKALNLKSGDRVDFFKKPDGEYVLIPRNRSIRELEGCVTRIDHIVTLEEMNEGIADAVAECFLRSVGTLAVLEDDASKDEAK